MAQAGASQLVEQCPITALRSYHPIVPITRAKMTRNVTPLVPMSPRETPPAPGVWSKTSRVPSGLWCCDSIAHAQALGEQAYLRQTNVGRLVNIPITVAGVKSGKVSAVKKISKSQVAVEFTLTDGTKEPVTFYKDCGDSPHRVGTSWLPQLHQAGLSLW